MKKEKLKEALLIGTVGCTAQNGWTCGTCFFSISEELNNQDWQAVLLTRGDYKREDLNNLPQDIEKSLEKVCRLALYKRMAHN